MSWFILPTSAAVRRARTRRLAVVGAVIAAITMSGAAAVAEPKNPAKQMKAWSPFPLPKTKSVPVRPVRGGDPDRPANQTRKHAKRAASWPKADTASVRLPRIGRVAGKSSSPSAAASKPVRVRAGRLPISVGAAKATDERQFAQVRLFARSRSKAVGVTGPVWSVAQTAGQESATATQVALDYSTFADAYGGDWASRLQLVTLPACALTTPQAAQCRIQTPVPSTNSTTTQSLSGTIKPSAPAQSTSRGAQPMTVMAATAAPTGGAGDFKATPLSPSGTWTAGGSTGSFTYSYPITSPPSVGGPSPSVALTYDSSSSDGRSAASNNQPSWVGDGWDYSPGFIDRSYKSCVDDGHDGEDGHDKSGDECWAGDNATLSLAGHSSPLVPTGNGDTWRLQNDDGTRVEKLTVSESSNYANGLDNGTYWRVTTNDGTQYYFGASHLPASAGGDGHDSATDSAWDVPVYGDDDGEPCHAATFNDSRCKTGWRWNLDFVVDLHNNLIRYSYATERNYYKTGTGEGSLVSYVRAGRPTAVMYGQNVADYVANREAASRISFTTVERCDASGGFDCSTGLSESTASHWPDVPFDQICGSAGSCDNRSPSFFTRRALSQITTQVWNTSLTTPAYSDVDVYTMSDPTFPDPQDAGQTGGAAKPGLWLASISHSGKDARGGGDPADAQTVTFGGRILTNRVPGVGLPNLPSINRFRLSAITTETGSTIAVTYDESAPCTQAPDEDNNHTRCFPVRWTPVGYTNPKLDWFRIYPVARIDENDNNSVWGASGSPSHITEYDYDTPAWHRDDSPLTPDDTRTWGQFRGFAAVTAQGGAGPDPLTKTVSRYLQGMNNDYKKDGKPAATDSVATASGDSLTDSNALSGFNYQSATYSSATASGTAQLITVNHPWLSSATATKSIPDLPDLVARFENTDRVDTRQLVSDGTWRTARTRTTFDDNSGLATDVEDLGEVDGSGVPIAGAGTPRNCTHTDYASNTARNMTNYPSLVVTTAGTCVSAVGNDTVAANRTYYDGAALGTVGAHADVTSTQQLQQAPTAEPPATSAIWTQAATAAFDGYGRTTSKTDFLGKKVDTDFGTGRYQPTTIRTTSYSPTGAGWDSTVTLDPARALPLTTTDVNGNTTSMVYDSLGRLTQAWAPNHLRATYPNLPTAKFTYQISRTGYTATRSSTLRDDNEYSQVVQIFDALGQIRQTQTSPPTGESNTRLISDVGYDSHGWMIYGDQEFYNNDAAPSMTPVAITPGSIPARTTTEFDARGRATKSSFYSNGSYQWATATNYPGEDRVDTTPADGGTPTSSITDARGQQSQLRQYQGHTPSGAYDVTYYSHDAAGLQTKIIGPLASSAPTSNSPLTWTTTYDALGNAIKETDPDAGTKTSTYNAAGQVTSAKDAAGNLVNYHYDSFGRNDYVYSGTDSSKKIASWTYDAATNGRGLPATATRYASNGVNAAYTSSVSGYTATGNPTGSTVSIPANTAPYDNAAAITYSTTNTYTRNLDLPYTQKLSDSATSAIFGATETVGTSYNLGGLPVASGGAKSYETNTFYDPHGRVIRAVAAAMPKQVALTYSWDEPTGRLGNFTTNREDGSAAVDNVTYTYDQSGNITSARNRIDGGATPAAVDQQCFRYDYLHRLTNAWTSSGTTAPSNPLSTVGAVGACADNTPNDADTFTGPAKYWTSYDYDAAGNRIGASSRTFKTDNTVSTTSSSGSTYARTGGAGPHGVTTVTTGSSTTTYGYVRGNTTTTRTSTAGAPDATKDQNFTWSKTGQLDELKIGTTGTPTTTSSYSYDPEGNLVGVTTTPKTGNKTSVLYLGNDMVTLDATGKATKATRQYPFPGGPTAVRSGTLSGSTATVLLHFQANDPHGTATTDFTADTLAVSRRYYDPFGVARATVGSSFAGDRGFVGGTKDTTTSLTNLGAREYDPAQGRFLSVDPVLIGTAPQSLNGYSYAENDPINQSDPSGKCPYAEYVCEGERQYQKTHDTVGCGGCFNGPGTTPGSPAPVPAQKPVDPRKVKIRIDIAPGDVSCDPDSQTSNCLEAMTYGIHTTTTLYALQHPPKGPKNYCGWAGIICDLVGVNQTIRCFANGDVGDCVGAVIAVGTDLMVLGKGFKLLGLAGGGRLAAAGAGEVAASQAAATLNTGKNAVYYSTNAAGDINYVGITNNLTRRAAEHVRSKGIVIRGIPGLSNLSRADARAVEQVLIETNGGAGGGQLLNRINSISPKSATYGGAIRRGCAILGTIGYPAPGVC